MKDWEKILVERIIGDEPFIMNFQLNQSLVKDGKPVIYFPQKKSLTKKEAGQVAALVALNGIKD